LLATARTILPLGSEKRAATDGGRDKPSRPGEDRVKCREGADCLTFLTI
jgi:hypothetical protein